MPIVSQWGMFILIILTWCMSAALTYGIVITKVTYLEKRVDLIEMRQVGVLQNALNRGEYQAMHATLEAKVDRNFHDMIEKFDELKGLIQKSQISLK